MKQLLNLFMAVAIILSLSYCGEDDPKPDDTGNGTDTTDTGGGGGGGNEPLTPEENKALLQDIGVEFVGEMSAMQQTAGVKALLNLGVLVDGEDDEEPGGRANLGAVARLNKSIVGFAYGKITAQQFGAASAAIAQDDDDDFDSFGELFSENTGTYEYNPTIDDFDYTDNSTDKVIVKFPSPETNNSNNATLTMSNYTGVTLANPIDDYTGDLPTGMTTELMVDGTVAVTHTFSVDWNNEGIPEQMSTTLSIDPFSLTVTVTNTTSKVGSSVDFKNGSKTVIGTSFEVNGDFSEGAINDAEANDDDITKVIDNGSFTFTLLDMKLIAAVEFADLYNEVGDLETSYYEYPGNTDPKPDLEANSALLEAALNKHLSVTTSYVSTGKTAASVEWYTFVETEDYGNNEVDYYVELGARMVFDDGSKIDLEDYLGTGFSQLEASINDLLGEIGEDIGEDIEDIDFGDLGG